MVEEEISNEQLAEIYTALIFMLRRIHAQEARRKLRVGPGMAVHHIDGNPHNNDTANLRLVSIRANRP